MGTLIAETPKTSYQFNNSNNVLTMTYKDNSACFTLVDMMESLKIYVAILTTYTRQNIMISMCWDLRNIPMDKVTDELVNYTKRTFINSWQLINTATYSSSVIIENQRFKVILNKIMLVIQPIRPIKIFSNIVDSQTFINKHNKT